jgi:murein DD-endopeptidase MepM/ murein hydrolase activator NlpD
MQEFRRFQVFSLRTIAVFLGIVGRPLIGVSIADQPPQKYVIDYPAVTRVVPPVRSTFYEVTRTVETVNGKTFRHPLNGGFGFKLKHPLAKHVVHLGADLGWFRVGEPVFAVAEGIVRISKPALLATSSKTGANKSSKLPPGSMLWGNFIVIEHRLKNGAYVTTLYGHLGKRLVNVGDPVKPGQQIGTIGRKSVKVNGGYKPHLHFGVRYGRAIEKGRTLFTVQQGAKLIPVNVAEVTPDAVKLDFGEAVDRAPGFRLSVNGTLYQVEEKDGKFYMPATMLWSLPLRSFPLIGYADSTDGWVDPVAFLRNPDIVKPGLPSGRNLTKPIVLKVYDVLGKPAPSWGVKLWTNLPDDKKTIDASDYKGKIVAIFCFQVGCSRCRSYGFANWKEVMQHYQDDPNIRFVAIQTAHENFTVNRFSRAKKVSGRFGRKIPIGHDGTRRQKPAIMTDYGVNRTPWMIVIDTEGRVRINVVMPNPDSCIQLIELVKDISKLATQREDD